LKDKFVFRYDRHTKKGIIKSDKGEFEINLTKKQSNPPPAPTSGGSIGGGFGLHLI